MGSNCMASCSIGCLFCCQGCNAEKLRNAFAFLPPPPSYTVEPKESSGSSASAAHPHRMVYESEGLKNYSFYQQAADHADVHFLKTARGERIPIVWIRQSGASSASSPPPADRQPAVLLHCHGNATDIGMMMGPYFELAKQLGIEVVGVEYSGYGISTGSASARNTQCDIEAAYDFLISSGVAPERIVAYGQSVGSGPVVSLAAKRELGGIVLHSPMLSGIKVIDPEPDRCCRPSCVYRCFDFFPNDKRMRRLGCPGFIIHGQLDDIIPFYHGAQLLEALPKQYQWPGYFPRGAGHNDVVEINASAYFGEVSAFLRAVMHRASSGSEELIKPGQIEMEESMQKRSNCQLEPARVPPRDVSNEADTQAIPDLPYKEPKVGPEDGRYANMRGARKGPEDTQ